MTGSYIFTRVLQDSRGTPAGPSQHSPSGLSTAVERQLETALRQKSAPNQMQFIRGETVDMRYRRARSTAANSQLGRGGLCGEGVNT